MLTVQQQPTEEQFTTAFQQADEGEIVFEGFHDGHRVTVTKKNGQPVVDAVAEESGEVRAEGFCHAAAMGAVLALGSAGLAFMAASGGGYILGRSSSAPVWRARCQPRLQVAGLSPHS